MTDTAPDTTQRITLALEDDAGLEAQLRLLRSMPFKAAQERLLQLLAKVAGGVHAKGYDEGFEAGEVQGYDKGYDRGYEKGSDDQHQYDNERY